MKLYRKLHIITSLFTSIAIVFVIVVFMFLSKSSYYDVEQITYMKTMTSIKSVIEKEFESLEFILSDWAEWDATYEYVQGLKPDYVEDNIGEDILDDLDLDYFYIISETDDVLYGYKKNMESGELELINKEIMNTFINHKSETGIMLLGSKLIFFSSMGITDNEAEELPIGNIGFGRVIDDEMILFLEESTDHVLKVDINNVQTDDHNISITGGYHIIGELIHNKKKASMINIKVPIINDESELVIHADLENTIQRLGNDYAIKTIRIVILILIMLGLLVDFTIRKLVVKRFIKLNNEVENFRKDLNPKERIGFYGTDEIGELSANINALLEEIDEKHEEVSFHTTYDEMTGLYNRKVGLNILDECVRNANENDIPFSIVYLDIDELKKVNDNFGHQIGDQLIHDAVQIIRRTGNKTKYIVRLGGDEFLVIMKNTDKLEAEIFEEQIKRASTKFNENTEKIYVLSFSTGSVQYEKDISIGSLLELADKKMYEKKETVEDKKI